MSIESSSEYQTYAQSTCLSSAIPQPSHFSDEDLLSVQNSFTLSGNVDQNNLSAYCNSNPNYTFKLINPYASQGANTLDIWGKYFADTLNDIKQNILRRNGNAIPLDFADVMILIASLSSLISLSAPDLLPLPDTNHEYLALAHEKNGNDKQKCMLQRDPILFRWFVCTYLLNNLPHSQGEDIAKGLYSALRCGIVHSLTVGQILRQGATNYEITVAARNVNSGSNKWYDIHSTTSKCYTFYLLELLHTVETLVVELFDSNSISPSIQRFQNDAQAKLTGKYPIMLLQAIPKQSGK